VAFFLKTVLDSLKFILVTTLLSIAVGSIVRGRFSLAYVFNANLIVGAAIICTGLIIMLLPTRFKFGKLVDHTTFSERYLEHRRQKQEKSREFLFLGLFIVIITGLLQLLLAALI